MEAAILEYAEAEEKKRNPNRVPSPGIAGWFKDRISGVIFGIALLTIACIVQYFE